MATEVGSHSNCDARRRIDCNVAGSSTADSNGQIRPFHLLWSESDRGAKIRLLAALSFALAAGLLTAFAPVVLKQIVDGLTETGNGTALIGSTLLLYAYVVSHWLAKSFNELRLSLHSIGEQRLYRKLSGKLFSHLMTLPLGFHLGRETGGISQALTNGLTGYRLVLTHFVLTVVPITAQLIGVASVLVILGHSVFLGIIVGAIVAYAIVFSIGVVWIRSPAREVSAMSVLATGLMTDSIFNFEAVKYSGAEADVGQRYDEALTRVEEKWREFYSRRARNGLLAAAVFGVALAFTVGFAYQGVRTETMTVGDFVMAVSFVLLTMGPIETLGYAVRDLTQGRAFIQQLLALLNETPERDVAGSRVPKTSETCGALSFERVRFSYDGKRSIHDDISFRCAPGQSIALVGPSGCGKSSIVRLLFRFFDANEGQIVLDGIPISKWPIAALRREIAVVPQDTILLNDTIARNISLGYRGLRIEDIEKAAKLASIHEFIVELPDGYHTVVGERGLKLSGGEKQRIAIARAALKKPRVFVFDEATSALDTHTERAILKNLIRVSHGVTSLFVAHRLSTIIHVDQILVMKNGSIVERGSHETLLSQNGMYANLWRSQLRDLRSSSLDSTQVFSASGVSVPH